MTMKTMTQTGILISSVLLLAACAGPAQTTLADGSVAYQLECDGSQTGLQRCLERAGKTCGAQGYLLVTQDGRAVSSAPADSQVLTKVFEDDMNAILFKCDS